MLLMCMFINCVGNWILVLFVLCGELVMFWVIFWMWLYDVYLLLFVGCVVGCVFFVYVVGGWFELLGWVVGGWGDV